MHLYYNSPVNACFIYCIFFVEVWIISLLAGCDTGGDTPMASVPYFAKQAAEIVTVDKAAAVRHLFNFQVITLQQRFGVFQPRMVQVFVKADGSRFLKQVREVVWRDIKRLRYRFARQRRGVVFINILPNGFKSARLREAVWIWLPSRSRQWLSRLATINLAVCCSCGCICISLSVCNRKEPIRGRGAQRAVS